MLTKEAHFITSWSMIPRTIQKETGLFDLTQEKLYWNFKVMTLFYSVKQRLLRRVENFAFWVFKMEKTKTSSVSDLNFNFLFFSLEECFKWTERYEVIMLSLRKVKRLSKQFCKLFYSSWLIQTWAQSWVKVLFRFSSTPLCCF